MGTMLDTADSDPAAQFSGLHFDSVAAYGNGSTANYARAKAAYPHLPILEIDVLNTGIGNAGDFEGGNIRYDEAGEWAAKRIRAGVHRPVLYFQVSEWTAVQKSVAAAGLHLDEVRIWTAHYTGRPHRCSSACGFVRHPPALADATQWGTPGYLPPPYAGHHIDVSETSPDFHGNAAHDHHHHHDLHHHHDHHHHLLPSGKPAARWTRVLERGVHGEDVAHWQERMRHRGFATLKVDHEYGDHCAQSCRWLQLYLGVRPTEQVDEALWHATFTAP